MEKWVEELQEISHYECDKDVVLYGLNGFISALVSIGLLVLTSFLNHGLKDLLVFLPIHMIGVRYTGGYHAKTPLRCQVLTVISYVMVHILTRFCLLYVDVKWICLVGEFCVLFIWLMSPVLNVKKPMTYSEIKINRTRARIFALLMGAMLFASVFAISSKWLAASLLSNLIEISIFMFLGRRLYVYEKAKNGRNDVKNGRTLCNLES